MVKYLHFVFFNIGVLLVCLPDLNVPVAGMSSLWRLLGYCYRSHIIPTLHFSLRGLQFVKIRLSGVFVSFASVSVKHEAWISYAGNPSRISLLHIHFTKNLFSFSGNNCTFEPAVGSQESSCYSWISVPQLRQMDETPIQIFSSNLFWTHEWKFGLTYMDWFISLK